MQLTKLEHNKRKTSKFSNFGRFPLGSIITLNPIYSPSNVYDICHLYCNLDPHVNLAMIHPSIRSNFLLNWTFFYVFQRPLVRLTHSHLVALDGLYNKAPSCSCANRYVLMIQWFRWRLLSYHHRGCYTHFLQHNSSFFQSMGRIKKLHHEAVMNVCVTRPF